MKNNHASASNNNGFVKYNVLEEARQIVSRMTKRQRFQKSRRHLIDALNYQYPRNDPDLSSVMAIPPSFIFRFCYRIQTSTYWQFFLFILTIMYMYLIVMEPNNRLDLTVQFNLTTAILNNVILFILIIDLAMQVIHKTQWHTRPAKKYNFLFWTKVLLIVLFIIDHVVFYTLYNTYPLRPFRILRAFAIYLYDHFSRKALHALCGAASDILAFIVFFVIIIGVFGIASAHIIQLPSSVTYDSFTQNFSSIKTSTFLMYVLSTYDAWPDYQMKVIDTSQWYYVFFLAFMFLNLFYFITIPVTFIFTSFKITRSKIMLLDQVKQQNSLLLCFISLTDKQNALTLQTFHQFMLFVYKNKTRYAHQIKELSFKMDPNNNSVIVNIKLKQFVSDFMKLGKYMEESAELRPPLFDDWLWFIRFRDHLNYRLHLDKIVESDWYEVVIMLVVIVNIIIVLLSFFEELAFYHDVEIGFAVFYGFQFIARFFGQGPEKMFSQERTWADVAMIIVTFSLLYSTNRIDTTLDKLTRMVVILRLNRIVRILWRNKFFRKKIYLSPFYCKLRLLFNQLYICAIVGLKMFPLVMTCFYTVSIVGMERFDNRFNTVQPSSPYDTYDAYSSFRSLVQAHLLCVQFMIESSWSYITYDYAYRYGNFAEAVVFFSFVHFFVVLVLISLMKGMAADFYETIKEKYDQVISQELGAIELEEKKQQYALQCEEIVEILRQGKPLTQDTIHKKQFIELKQNKDMIQALIQMLKKDQKSKMQKTRTTLMLQHPSIDQINNSHKSKSRRNSSVTDEHLIEVAPEINNTMEQMRRIDSMPIEEIGSDIDLESEGIQDEIVDRIVLQTDVTPFSMYPLYPPFLKKFILQKLIPVPRRDLGEVPLIRMPSNHNINTMGSQCIGQTERITNFYTNSIESLLGVKQLHENRKKLILVDILKLKLTDPDEIRQELNRKQDPLHKIQLSSILRSVYLGNLNKQLVNKFEEEYFEDIYGNTFLDMNKAILNPILRQEALIISSLSKILRYPNIPTNQFFTLLATIEHKISSDSILKTGSIFKLVFQVEGLAQNWFAIEVKQNRQLRLHFIKSSIWVYHRHMEANRIFYANDIFSYNPQNYPGEASDNCQKIIRLLYNSFESIGFSMLDEDDFFSSDPSDYAYDLYTLLIPTDDLQAHSEERIGKYNLRVTNLMIVMLARQNERPVKLGYNLTTLSSLLQDKQNNLIKQDFRLEDDNHQTLEKLRNLEAQDQEKISKSTGLPYAYLVDMMISIQDIISSKKQNLIRRVEQVLNQQFDKDTSLHQTTC